MKKVISMLLVIALFASFMVTTAFAADGAYLEVTGAGTVNRGDEFTLTVNIKNNPGINGGQFSITYGSDLTLTAITQGSVLNGMLMPNPTAGAASYAGMSNATGDGTIFTLTFKVKEDAKGGAANVTVSVPKATTSLGPGKSEPITVASGSTSVNVYVPHVCAPKAVAEVPATCTAAGTKAHYACDCGKLYSDAAGKNEIAKAETIPAKGHSYDNGVVTTQPSCGKAGVKTFTCSACGNTKTESVAALTHSYDKGVVTTPAECGKAGVKTFTCANCGDKKTESIPALNHNYVGEVTKESTCAVKGVKTFTCTLCGDSYTEELPLAEHTWSEVKTTKEPTCTEKGEKAGSCSVCKAEGVKQEIPALGHKWDNGKITTAATCEKDGVKTYTCENDKSHTKTEAVKANGHDWDNGEITTAATCEKDGVKTYTCKNDKTHTKTEAVKAIGHKWDEGKITTAATCDKDGVKTFTCENDKAHTKTEAVKATGHKVDTTKYESDAKQHWNVCQTCDAKLNIGEHKHDQQIVVKPSTSTVKGSAYDACACGNFVDKNNDGKPDTYELPLKADVDSSPKTGDVTGMITAAVVTMVAMLAAVAFVFKRKAAK